MRVDHHLLRRMLETIEAAPAAEIPLMPELACDAATQRYHLQLLIDAGYVTAQQLRRYGPACALSLTLVGQEQINQLRHRNSRQARPWVERLLSASVARLVFALG